MQSEPHSVSSLLMNPVCYDNNSETIQCGSLHFNLLHFSMWSERGVIAFTDWAHNVHSVFFEQSKNAHYVPTHNGSIVSL